jgi:hypothetical protein
MATRRRRLIRLTGGAVVVVLAAVTTEAAKVSAGFADEPSIWQLVNLVIVMTLTGGTTYMALDGQILKKPAGRV